MKYKTLIILSFLCIAGTFWACANQTTDQTSPNSFQTVTESESTEQSTSQVAESEEIITNEIQTMPDTPVILALEQTRNTRYEGLNEFDKLLVLSEYSCVNLWWEDAQRYSEMAGVLSEISTMQKNAMEDEADNLLSFATEMLEANPDSFETQVSTVDVQVRRADSMVISLLSDSLSDYGFIDDYHGIHGSNYETETGRELKLSDVIKDIDSLSVPVEKELNSHIWAGDYYSLTAVDDYFKNTPEDGISWTLDYNGVTFYFADGDLAEMGNGRQTATVSFAEYPELFEEKYMTVPDAYMVSLPLDTSFFSDLDGNGTLEELNCTGVYNRTDRLYSQFGLYTDMDGHYHYEELFAYDFNPYYVKASDGNHYLYLFCEESETSDRQMHLVVYNVTGGSFTKVGEMNVGPAYIPSDIFRIPTDPNQLWLDDHDGLAQDAELYMVGHDGMPVKK